MQKQTIKILLVLYAENISRRYHNMDVIALGIIGVALVIDILCFLSCTTLFTT